MPFLRASTIRALRSAVIIMAIGYALTLAFTSCLSVFTGRTFSLFHQPTAKSALIPVLSTASELQDMLTSGTLKSVDAVAQFLSQIAKHDGYLKAVISIAPNALLEARRLDEERANGHVRGPFHGIPILIKDNIATHPSLGMGTTAGSFALSGSQPRMNAGIITKLLDAGAIILGKTQLSEFAGYKGSSLPPGWSAIGGQIQSAYTTGDYEYDDLGLGNSSPGGSSTGSAVSVSAGYAPLAVGTDTTGSILTPSSRAALYSLRVTTGIVDMYGVVPFSKDFDSIGPMAKSPLDVANFLDIVVDRQKTRYPIGGYAQNITWTWDNIRVGVLDIEKWNLPEWAARPNAKAYAQMAEMREAYSKIKSVASKFKEVELLPYEDLVPDNGESLYDLFAVSFKEDMKSYLETLDYSKVSSLEDIVQFNKDHANKELPKGFSSQDLLVGALEQTMEPSQYDSLLSKLQNLSRQHGIDKTLEDAGVDVIIAPSDSGINLLACAAGYPSATLPLSYLDFNGRPFGLTVLTTAHHEHMLLKVMGAWEATFPARRPPQGY